MKNVTKFDLDAAFKALDEIGYPTVKGLKPNRNIITESAYNFKKQNTEVLLEDYYDIEDNADLEQAQTDRDAEIAKAKLARIEKIVDLDAESEEDILPSYVGKYIIQCPQCMQMFYKNEEDLVKDEADPETVNVGEVCQHCGNDSGYSLIGKVGAVEDDEMANYTGEEAPAEELPAEEEPAEEQPEEENNEEENNEEDLSLDMDEVPVEEEPEEEKKEESFNRPTGHSLTEDLDCGIKDFDSLNVGGGFNWYYGTLTDGRKFFLNTVPDELSIFNSDFDLENNIDRLFNCDENDCDDLRIWEDVFEPAIIEHYGHDDKKYIDMLACLIADNRSVAVEESLNESVNPELGAKLKAHNDYIEYLQAQIEAKEKALKAEKNDFVKEAIQKEIDSLTADLEAALPEALKAEAQVEAELPAADEIPEEAIEGKEEAEQEEEVKESVEKVCKKCGKKICECDKQKNASQLEEEVSAAEASKTIKDAIDSWDDDKEEESEKIDEAQCKLYKVISHPDEDMKELKEDFLPAEISDEDIDALFDSKEFETPVSEEEVEAIIEKDKAENESIDLGDAEDIDEDALNEHFTKYFVETYSNVKDFTTTNCTADKNKLVVEGKINFKSGKTKNTKFEFSKAKNKDGKVILEGRNKDLAKNNKFVVSANCESKKLITESIGYRYTNSKKVVKGNTNK